MATKEIKSLAVKLALENGSFSQGMADLRQNMKIIDSEFKSSITGVKDWGKSLDGLKANATALGEKINVQKDIIKAFEQQLQKSKDILSQNEKAMLDLKDKVVSSKTAWEQSKTAIGANNEATKKLKDEYDALNNQYEHSEALVRKNNTSVKNYTVEVNNAKGALNGMEAELTQTNNDIKNFDANAKKAAASASTMASDIDKKVNSVLKIFAVGLAAAATGMGALGKSSLEGASELEGYRNTLNVVMKDTQLAGEMFAWAVDFANKTPFETDSIVQATVRLQSYGLMAKEVLPAIGDMAGVMNKDIMQAVEAVADAQTGELERLKEFGITKQMVIDKANEIMRGKEIVNNQGQITDQENFNTALFALMNDRFKGGMEIQANSFKGLWSTVTGVVKTSLAQMMGITDEGGVVIGGAFDIIKNKIKSVADTLQKWSKDGTLKEIGNKLQSAFIGVVNFITNNVIPTIGFFIKNFDTVKTVIIGVVSAMAIWKTATTTALVLQAAQNTLAIASALAHGGQAAATAVATKAQWGLNAAMVANPIGAIIAAVVALIAIIGSLIWWYNSAGDAAKQAADEEIAAERKAAEEARAEHAKIAASKKAEINEKIQSEKNYHDKQSSLLQKEYDDEMAVGQKKLEALKKALAERQNALDDYYNKAIKAIQDEYGVFEEKQKSKTELVQEEYNKKLQTIADIVSMSQNAATQEGEAYVKAAEDILEKSRSLHNEKITMYTEEYLLSIGVINDELRAKVKGFQDEITAIQKKTDDENALIKAQADAEKLIDLQKKVDQAKTDEERLAANEALQAEINRQNREKLLEQRKNEIDSLNQKIKDANEKAADEKNLLLQKLKDRLADEQVEIKKNADYNISEIQRERKAKESAETLKYEAAKKSLDKEEKYLENWIDNVYKPLIDEQYDKVIRKENERHNLVMKNHEKELEAAASPEEKEAKDIIKKAEADKSKITGDIYPDPNNPTIKITVKDQIKMYDKVIEDQKKILRDMGIPGYAKGTSNHPGGYAITDEGNKGELKYYPSGTVVVPHDISMQIARSIGSSVSTQNNISRGEVNLHFHVGNLVGQDGMHELSSIVSRDLAHEFGLITGGAY